MILLDIIGKWLRSETVNRELVLLLTGRQYDGFSGCQKYSCDMRGQSYRLRGANGCPTETQLGINGQSPDGEKEMTNSSL